MKLIFIKTQFSVCPNSGSQSICLDRATKCVKCELQLSIGFCRRNFTICTGADRTKRTTNNSKRTAMGSWLILTDATFVHSEVLAAVSLISFIYLEHDLTRMIKCDLVCSRRLLILISDFTWLLYRVNSLEHNEIVNAQTFKIYTEMIICDLIMRLHATSDLSETSQ